MNWYLVYMVKESHLVTTRFVATRLGLTRRRVKQLAHEGKLRATKIPGSHGPYLFDPTDVEEFAAKREALVSAKAPAKAPAKATPLGTELTGRLRRAKVTQVQVSLLLGITQPAVSKKMRGERRWTLAEYELLDTHLLALEHADEPEPEQPAESDVPLFDEEQAA